MKNFQNFDGCRHLCRNVRLFAILPALLLLAGDVAAWEPNEKAAKPQQRLSGRLLKVLPPSANRVVTVNLTAIRANASYLRLKKDPPRQFADSEAEFVRECGVPLKIVERLTFFNRRGDTSRDQLFVIQTDRAFVASKVIAAHKKHALSPPSEVRFQETTIRKKTVYSSTILTQGRRDPWSSFCLADDRTLLGESYGHGLIKEVLNNDAHRGSKLLKRALGATPASDVLFVAMDLSQRSAMDRPLFAVFHGNGPSPESLGRPQLLTLRISGRAANKIRVNIECQNGRKLAKSLKEYFDVATKSLKARQQRQPKEKSRRANDDMLDVLSKLSKSLKVKDNIVRLEADISAEALVRFIRSYFG